MSWHNATDIDLVALHGWGLSSRVWAPLAERMAGVCRWRALDLPGHGDAPVARGLNTWVDAIAARAPESAVYLGWSLGGVVALALALRYPERVRGLILAASVPCLMRAADWPWGMTPDTLDAIRRGLDTSFSTTLAGFFDQQVRGTPDVASSAARLKADLAARPRAEASPKYTELTPAAAPNAEHAPQFRRA